MKQKLSLLLLSAAMVSGANAALYTSSFSSPTFSGNGEIAGNDGWVISDSIPNLSFVANIGNGQALGLGGEVAGPANSSVSLSHAYVEDVGRITATFDFAIFDSTADYKNRDTFGFSINGASGSLFAVSFVPVVSAPTDPELDTDAKWSAFYSVNGGANQTLSLQVQEQIKYGFSLALGGTGANATYNITIGGLNRTGTATGLNPTTDSTAFAFNWTTTLGAASAGDNFIGADSLTVVPEPSSTLLLALTGLGLASRRRRA
jgi:hypothetical protein